MRKRESSLALVLSEGRLVSISARPIIVPASDGTKIHSGLSWQTSPRFKEGFLDMKEGPVLQHGVRIVRAVSNHHSSQVIGALGGSDDLVLHLSTLSFFAQAKALRKEWRYTSLYFRLRARDGELRMVMLCWLDEIPALVAYQDDHTQVFNFRETDLLVVPAHHQQPTLF